MSHRAPIAATLLLMIAIGLFAVPIVLAAPKAPHVLYGQARTADGTVLDSGLAIEARINNINYGQSVDASTGNSSQSVTTHSQDSSGLNYGTQSNFQACADDPGTGAVEGGSNGDDIFFFMAGIQAQALRVGVDTTPVQSIEFESESCSRTWA